MRQAERPCLASLARGAEPVRSTAGQTGRLRTPREGAHGVPHARGQRVATEENMLANSYPYGLFHRAFSTARVRPPRPPNRPPTGALALGERVSPRAPGSPPPPHRRVRRAAGQPGRPPARATGHGQDGWLVTGSL